LFPFVGDRLVIGRYCAIARGVKFIMNGANHRLSGFSTYPFNIFSDDWARVTPLPEELPFKGDTVVGHDVWLGYKALIMPGVNIGHGAIVAARSVVTADVPPYTIVGGNPARVVKPRFDESTVSRLLRIAWWDWDAARVTRHLEQIVGTDLEALEAAARGE
jgi:virginiamycin A acetyltransferase